MYGFTQRCLICISTVGISADDNILLCLLELSRLCAVCDSYNDDPVLSLTALRHIFFECDR